MGFQLVFAHFQTMYGCGLNCGFSNSFSLIHRIQASIYCVCRILINVLNFYTVTANILVVITFLFFFVFSCPFLYISQGMQLTRAWVFICFHRSRVCCDRSDIIDQSFSMSLLINNEYLISCISAILVNWWLILFPSLHLDRSFAPLLKPSRKGTFRSVWIICCLCQLYHFYYIYSITISPISLFKFQRFIIG